MNGKPRWTAYLCVLAYCSVAVLALNSYQERLKPVAVQHQDAETRPVAPVQLVTANQNIPLVEVPLISSETISERESAPADANVCVAEPRSVLIRNKVEVDKSAQFSGDDSKLLGNLAADLARSAMKEASIVLPRQIVREQPSRSVPPAKLVSFRLPRSTPKFERQPTSMLVSFQSRLLTVAADVRGRFANYIRWVRFCAAVRGLASEFKQSHVQPVLDRILNQQPADEVILDTDDSTYDMTRYAVPIAYPN